MAAEIFVDTSAWFPLAVRGDRAHGAVAEALRERIRRGTRVVTTNLVVAETHALLLRRTTRAAALAFVGHVGRPPNVILYSTPELEAQAVTDWLERYDDPAQLLEDIEEDWDGCRIPPDLEARAVR